MEIWTYMKWISKFRDLDVHFESTGTYLKSRHKFGDRQ